MRTFKEFIDDVMGKTRKELVSKPTQVLNYTAIPSNVTHLLNNELYKKMINEEVNERLRPYVNEYVLFMINKMLTDAKYIERHLDAWYCHEDQMIEFRLKDTSRNVLFHMISPTRIVAK